MEASKQVFAAAVCSELFIPARELLLRQRPRHGEPFEVDVGVALDGGKGRRRTEEGTGQPMEEGEGEVEQQQQQLRKAGEEKEQTQLSSPCPQSK